MIVSHKFKYIFVKTTKTAGSSIERALAQHCGPEDILTSASSPEIDGSSDEPHQSRNTENGKFHEHMHAKDIRREIGAEKWDEYFKFCVVRNPWDRMVSVFWFRLARRNDVYGKTASLLTGLGMFFTKFLFRIMVKRVSNIRPGYNYAEIILDEDGKFMLDEVIHFENLSEELDEICTKLNIPPLTLPHLKSQYRSKNKTYHSYYTKETMDLIQQKDKAIIDIADYKF